MVSFSAHSAHNLAGFAGERNHLEQQISTLQAESARLRQELVAASEATASSEAEVQRKISDVAALQAQVVSVSLRGLTLYKAKHHFL